MHVWPRVFDDVFLSELQLIPVSNTGPKFLNAFILSAYFVHGSQNTRHAPKLMFVTKPATRSRFPLRSFALRGSSDVCDHLIVVVKLKLILSVFINLFNLNGPEHSNWPSDAHAMLEVCCARSGNKSAPDKSAPCWIWTQNHRVMRQAGALTTVPPATSPHTPVLVVSLLLNGHATPLREQNLSSITSHGTILYVWTARPSLWWSHILQTGHCTDSHFHAGPCLSFVHLCHFLSLSLLNYFGHILHSTSAVGCHDVYAVHCS